MYRNLSPHHLGLYCSQTELIELTLTHGFGGFDLDLDNFSNELESRGADGATRLLKSARVQLNAGYLPVDLAAVDGKYQAEKEMTRGLLDALSPLQVPIVRMRVDAGNDDKPYHENFEFHRERLNDLGDFLAEYGLRLGLECSPLAADRARYAQPFITKPEELITLVKTTGHERVGMVADFWNWFLVGTPLEQLDQLSTEQIIEARFADPVGTLDTTASGKERGMPTLEGPSVPAFAKLKSMDFKGAVTIAPHPDQVEGKQEQLVLAAVRAHELLENPEKFAEKEATDEEDQSSDETEAVSSETS